jgi:HlyD family secretion protein
MEPADQSHLKPKPVKGKGATAVEFLPDADAIERTPLPWVLRATTHVLALAFLIFIVWATFSDVERIVVRARQKDAAVLCSGKDWAKF